VAFKPKRIEEPGEGGQAQPRPSSKELALALAPIASTLIPTAPPVPMPSGIATPAPEATPTPAPLPAPKPTAEPVLMMSFKASRPFAKMLAEGAEGEGGLRRLVARVFHEAGYPVPPSELQPQRRRRTYD
jgi:hypothetical protein